MDKPALERLSTAALPLFCGIVIVLFTGPTIYLQQLPGAASILLAATLFLLTVVSAALRNNLVAFFNAFALLFLAFPYYMMKLTGFSFSPIVSGSSFEAAAVYCLFQTLATFGALALLRRRPLATTADAQGTAGFSADYGIGVLLAIAVAATVALLVLYPETVLMSRYRYVSGEVARPSSIGYFIIRTLKFIPYWLLLIYLLQAGRRHVPVVGLGLVAFACICLALTNPITTPRYVPVAGLLLVFFGLVAVGHFRWIWRHFYFVPLLIPLINPVTSLIRGGTSGLSLQNIQKAFYSLEYSAYPLFNDMFLLGIQPFEKVDRLLTAFLILMPREIWPSKADAVGPSLAQAADYIYHNVAVPPVTNAYLDFGVAGVVLFAVLVAVALAGSSRALDRLGDYRLNPATAIGVAFAAHVPLFVRGDLTTFFLGFYQTLAAYFMIYLTLAFLAAIVISPRLATDPGISVEDLGNDEQR